MVPDLLSYCERRLPEALEHLRRMVEINSLTTNGPGVNAVGLLTAEIFAPLGFTASFTQAADPRFGMHLVLRKAAAPGSPAMGLVSHLDTVFSAEEEARNQFHWRVEGDRVYGPGTNDIKGGTVCIWLLLAALRDLTPAVFDGTEWVILLNACEEVNSIDFGDLCERELPATTRATLVFEGDGGTGDVFTLVAARKGRSTFAIDVSGRGSHAGSSHDRGANAVVQLAKVVSAVSQLTDYDAGVTVNVGSVEGGTVPNRVPHSARAVLEMRAFSTEVFNRTRDAILALAGEGEIRSAADGLNCRISVTMLDESCPWPPNPGTEKLIKLWQDVGAQLGLKVTSEHRGGLSDGNMIWHLFPAIDGLGPRGENCHCSERSADGTKDQEWADVKSFVPKTVMNAMCVLRLLGEER